MPRRRALSLIELLISLAIVAALAAIVVPSFLVLTGRASFQTAVRRIESAASTCRSESQEHGLAHRLIARSTDEGSVGLFSEPVGGDDRRAAAEDAPRRSASKADPSPQLLVVLPPGFRVTGEAPDVPRADATRAGGPVRAPADADPEAVPWTLATYLPDGSALVESPSYLVGDEGPAFQIEVSPFTGAARFIPMPDDVGSEGASAGSGGG